MNLIYESRVTNFEANGKVSILYKATLTAFHAKEVLLHWQLFVFIILSGIIPDMFTTTKHNIISYQMDDYTNKCKIHSIYLINVWIASHYNSLWCHKLSDALAHFVSVYLKWSKPRQAYHYQIQHLTKQNWRLHQKVLVS